MLIVHMLGGLGNQMFQYACGRALAQRWHKTVVFDIADYAHYPLHHGFELSRLFAAPLVYATPQDVRRVLGWRAPRAVRRALLRPRLAWLRGSRYIVEPHFHYWPDVTALPDDAYLVGYWQSPQYFADIAPVLRADFAFTVPLTAAQSEVAHQIATSNAISVHVRRGDYVSDAKTQAVHGVCPLSYYQTAYRYLQERLANPVCFVFSDDMAWVRANLHLDADLRFVDCNQGADSYADMRLMSLCRHHVIANSSFSWWGAWLNPNPEKIVIAPQHWFANQNDTRDLCPPDWIRY